MATEHRVVTHHIGAIIEADRIAVAAIRRGLVSEGSRQRFVNRHFKLCDLWYTTPLFNLLRIKSFEAGNTPPYLVDAATQLLDRKIRGLEYRRGLRRAMGQGSESVRCAS
jgi:hypothetical protein